MQMHTCNMWAWQYQQNGMCTQRWLRSARASAQSYQSLRSPHDENLGSKLLLSAQQRLIRITKTRLFKYIENFTTKHWKFSDKNPNFFPISAQNIDCRYSLEPPRQGGSNEYPQSMLLNWNKKKYVYPCKPQFYYIKVGLKGVKIV